MPRKKRRSLADTLRESGESHEKTLAEAPKVVRLVEKEDSQHSPGGSPYGGFHEAP